jgi:hypothetical protein
MNERHLAGPVIRELSGISTGSPRCHLVTDGQRLALEDESELALDHLCWAKTGSHVKDKYFLDRGLVARQRVRSSGELQAWAGDRRGRIGQVFHTQAPWGLELAVTVHSRGLTVCESSDQALVG